MSKNKKKIKKKSDIFLYLTKDVKKIKQDTIFHYPVYKPKKYHFFKNYVFEPEAHSFYFKNIFPKKYFLLCENPICYIKHLSKKLDIKKFKNGKYVPEIVLDLHGLNVLQAKKELGQFISICLKKKIFCANIIYGYGKKILKSYIPFWLCQHPDILAFHQAPKIFGSDAAILIIFEYSVSFK